MSIESFKVVFVGETEVWKTSILTQFIEKTFPKDIQTTTSSIFSTKTVICDGSKTLKFEIWDTAGQERYRHFAPMFYKDANALVIVYDVTKAKSFEEIKNYWINQIKENSPENIILVIVANKSDLIEQKQVDEGEARNFANDLNAIFISTSAKNNEGIFNIFEELAKKYTGATDIKIKEERDNKPNVEEGKGTFKIGNDKKGKKRKKGGFC